MRKIIMKSLVKEIIDGGYARIYKLLKIDKIKKSLHQLL